MNALRRGVKNAFRNTIRSVGVVAILAVAIALAISMLIARDAVTQKINSVRATTGNTISVSPKGFFSFQGGGTPLSNADVGTIAKIPDVSAVKASLNQRLRSAETSLVSGVTPGALGQQFGAGDNGAGAGGGGVGSSPSGSGSFSIPVTFTGTTTPGDALTGGATGGGTEKLTAGSSFTSSSTENVAIVGKVIASANSLSVDSTFTAWGATVKVVGIYDAASTFANNGVLMPLLAVQKLANLPGQVTSITVVVDSVDHVATVSKVISAKLGTAADVTSTQSIVQSELAPLNSVKTISTYTLIGAVIAAGIILLLSMLMIVRERRREIGVLKAIGAPNRSVIGQFMAESTTFTVLGSLAGLVLGIILGSPITSVLVSSNTSSATAVGGGAGGGFFRTAGGAPPPGGGFHFRGIRGIGSTITQVHAAASWSTLAFAFAAAILIAVIGSTVAVATIVRIRPAEVLRSE